MAKSFYKSLTTFADRILPQAISTHLRSAVRSRRDNRNRLERERRETYWDRNKGSGKSITVVIQPGVELILHFDSVLGRLIHRGGYEAEERAFLNLYLRPGDVFIDVGANIGLFSVIASKIVGDKGHVHAFEPCAQTASRLAANIKHNQCRNVSCHQVALSDQAGEIDMMVSLEGYDGWNSLAMKTPGEAGTVEKVKTAAWDDMAGAICADGIISAMKVDIEGWESHFIAGAKKFLARPDAPVLLMEFNDEMAAAAGSSGGEVHRTLEELGYQWFRYDCLERELYADPVRAGYRYINLVAAKDPKAVRTRLRSGSSPGWIY